MKLNRLSSLVACALLSGTVLAGSGTVASAAGPPGGVRLDPSLRVHPALQYGAQAEPDKKVRVLVQKTSPAVDGNSLARGVGATPDEEFTVVPTTVMEVPQRAVLALAHDPHVRYISPDGAIQKHSSSTPALNIDPSHLVTTYPTGISADKIWNDTTGLAATGQGVTVAVLDTGVQTGHPDFKPNQVSPANVNKATLSSGDGHGHGTHVIGTIVGQSKDGAYIGVAPNANVLSVKIADDTGAAHEADLLRGLQYVFDNRVKFNIKAVNLSVAAATAQSYATSPIDAAVEQLWLNGITVVVAAGNRGSATDAVWYAPANDPYAITVGCLDDNQTATNYADDSLCTFSSRGTTQDGFAKPEVVAPGRKIISALAGTNTTLAQQFPSRISADGQHIRLSGTSMAAPVVSGLVALLLEKVPTLTPDQVKWLLTNNAKNYTGQPDKAGEVNAMPTVSTAVKPGPKGILLANAGLTPNRGINLSTDTVMWGTSYWDTSYWDTSYWDTSYWDVMSNYD